MSQAMLFDKRKINCGNYDLYTLKEAENAVIEMIDYIFKNIIPEFKKIKNLDDLNKWFNEGDYMTTSKRLKIDIMYGLIVAKLVSNPNYDSLKNNYLKRTGHFSEWDKNELNNVLNFLDSNSLDDITASLV